MRRRLAFASLAVLLAAGCGPKTSTVVQTGKAARAPIAASGVVLPPSATDLYYAFQPQFADNTDTWISFSASAGDCMAVATSLAASKTAAPVFVAGTQSHLDSVTGGPGYHQPKYASHHWDLSTVANCMMFETTGLFVLVDTVKNRVYIALQAP